MDLLEFEKTLPPFDRDYMFICIVTQKLSPELKEDILNWTYLDYSQVEFIEIINLENIKDKIELIKNKYNFDKIFLVDFDGKIKDVDILYLDFSTPDLTINIDALMEIDKQAIKDFPHLHLHDEYSLRDGLGTISQRIDLMKEKKWSYLTATNHGSIGGWAKQYSKANNENYKSIFGVEMYFNEYRNYTKEDAKDFDDEMKKKFRENYHFTAHAKNRVGFYNLIKLNNDAQKNGFYYVPRCDFNSLNEYGKGLIITSGDGGAGYIPNILMNDELTQNEREEKALDIYKKFSSCVDDFYIELNILDWEDQREINRRLIKFAKKYKIPFIITTDAHYLRKEDYKTHEILLMIRDNKTMVDKAKTIAGKYLKEKLEENGMCSSSKEDKELWESEKELRKQISKEAYEEGLKYLEKNKYSLALEKYKEELEKTLEKDNVDTIIPEHSKSVWEFVEGLYVKDYDDIYETWKVLHKDCDVFTEEVLEEAFYNTRKYAKFIDNFVLDTSIKLPNYSNSFDILKEKCYNSMKEYGFIEKEEYNNRLEHELKVIKDMSLSMYFLILEEIISFCMMKKVTKEDCERLGVSEDFVRDEIWGCGPGRGSAAGSLISYLLGITQIDPLKFNLLFERFFEEGRFIDGIQGQCFDL